MKKPHKHSAIIKAWADGEKVQFRHHSWQEWSDIETTPIWTEETDYRIKPETKTDFVFYSVASVYDADIAKIEHIGMFNNHPGNNLKLTFDSETGKLKSAEVLK